MLLHRIACSLHGIALQTDRQTVLSFPKDSCWFNPTALDLLHDLHWYIRSFHGCLVAAFAKFPFSTFQCDWIFSSDMISTPCQYFKLERIIHGMLSDKYKQISARTNILFHNACQICFVAVAGMLSIKLHGTISILCILDWTFATKQSQIYTEGLASRIT